MQLFDPNGTEVTCASDQIELLLKSGWTKTKNAKKVEDPKPVTVKKEDKPAPAKKPAKSED